MRPDNNDVIAGNLELVRVLRTTNGVLEMGLNAAKAEIERLRCENEDLRAQVTTIDTGQKILLQGNARLQARVAELERLLGLCSAWIDPDLVIMETGEFLKPVVLKALESQPQKETPKPGQTCTLCRGTGIMPGEHDVSDLYKQDSQKEAPHA